MLASCWLYEEAGLAGNGRMVVDVIVRIKFHVLRMIGCSNVARISSAREIEEDVGQGYYGDHGDFGDEWLGWEDSWEPQVLGGGEYENEANLMGVRCRAQT